LWIKNASSGSSIPLKTGRYKGRPLSFQGHARVTFRSIHPASTGGDAVFNRSTKRLRSGMFPLAVVAVLGLFAGSLWVNAVAPQGNSPDAPGRLGLEARKGQPLTNNDKLKVRQLVRNSDIFQSWRSQGHKVKFLKEKHGREKRGGGERFFADATVFNYTLGETWVFKIDQATAAVEALRMSTRPGFASEEEQDEALDIIKRSALRDILRDSAPHGFFVTDLPGGNSTDRVLQVMLMTPDQRAILARVYVNLTTESIVSAEGPNGPINLTLPQ
jgi:hypothetical protein